MKNPLIYQIIDKYAEFIKPPWLIGKASASNQGGGAHVIFRVYIIIIYNIILYNIYNIILYNIYM
jgi:hypothetical protein